MVGCKSCTKKRRTDWISTLLESEFFGSCTHHREFRKNEKNAFCIDCSLGFCRHCVTAHCLHRRLQICKYVYHDVVRIHDMQKHLDCSKIQTYKINGERAVHLNPRPILKDNKPSTKSKFGGTCETCGRHIQDLPNRFCSIACKVSAVPVKLKDQSQNLITASIPRFGDLSWKDNIEHYPETNTSEMESSITMAESTEEVKTWVNSSLKPRKVLNKRKGIPHRAPIC